MTQTENRGTLSDRGQAIGLRLIARAGGLGVIKNPAVRSTVEKVLYAGARQGFTAQARIQRAFVARGGSGEPRRNPIRTPRREFDLRPTEDQQMIRDAARDLAQQVLRPAAAQADVELRADGRVLDQARELGLTLLAVPSDLGGIAEERSAVTGVLVLEELARGDLGLAVRVSASGAIASALAAYGDDAQQQTFLLPFTDDDAPVTGALALMEPEPLADPLHPNTTARRDGDELILDGIKSLVPIAADADLFLVGVHLDGEARLVLVEAGTGGVRVSPDPGMGVRAAGTGRLELTAARVPATNLLGTASDTRDLIRRSRLAWAAAAVGVGQAVLDQVRGYVIERQAFGEPIAHRQAVAFTVADMAIELEGLRLVVWRAAARLDSGQDAGDCIAHARRLAARHGARIGSEGVQLLGGHGFVKEFANERWYRDLRATGVLEGGLSV